jgi:hypothetical protein
MKVTVLSKVVVAAEEIYLWSTRNVLGQAPREPTATCKAARLLSVSRSMHAINSLQPKVVEY